MLWRCLPLIWRNTWRNRRRSLLTILSVATSFCLLGVLVSFYYAFFLAEQTPEDALRLVVRHRVSMTNMLNISYGGEIRRLPGVKAVTVMQWFGGTYKDQRETSNLFPQFSVNPAEFHAVYPEFRTSEDERRAFERERTACMLGRPLAERLGLRLGDRVTLVGTIFPATLELTVRAIYDSNRDRENLMFHHDYLVETLPRGWRDLANMFAVMTESPEKLNEVAAAIDERFKNSPAPTKTETMRSFELTFLAYLGNVKMFLLSICGALTFTLLLVSANTMAMAVRERVREVGVLKTLGYQTGTILGMLLCEGVATAVAGGVLGLLGARGVNELLRGLPQIFIDMARLRMPAAIVVACLGLAAVIGLASCVAPAYGAARKPITEALRFVD